MKSNSWIIQAVFGVAIIVLFVLHFKQVANNWLQQGGCKQFLSLRRKINNY